MSKPTRISELVRFEEGGTRALPVGTENAFTAVPAPRETTLRPLSSGATVLQALPCVTSTEWEGPASNEEIRVALAMLCALVDPNMSAESVALIAKQLAAYRYSRAELILAVREVPRDPKAAHNYRQGLKVSDIERVIGSMREIRKKLKRPVTAPERDELLASCPELRPEWFQCSGFDERYPDVRMYRYVEGGSRKRGGIGACPLPE